MAIVNVLTVFLLVYSKSTVVRTANSEEFVNLCVKNDSNISYSEYRTLKSSSCDCADPERCLRKCCQFGFVHNVTRDDNKDGRCIKNSTFSNFSVVLYNSTFKSSETNVFVIGMLNCNNTNMIYQYFKFNHSDPHEKYYLQADGTLYYPNSKRKFYKNDRFCVDEGDGLSVYLCYTPESPQKQVSRLVNSTGMIISMPFLFITFLVYFILPERNVHRRALMNYVLSLLCGYISLVTIQLLKNEATPLPEVQCHMIGYSIVFFFIVSFFWMNVMCIDMWLAFSGLRRFSGRKNAEQKKFILFCIYAWGMPALLILLIYFMNTYADEKAIYHPQLGKGRCFLEEGYPNLFYFYLPMAILITVNVILCILTAVRIQTVKRETKMLKHGDSKRHSYESDKQKFKLYLKLIFAMGINWSMEVISWVILWQWHDLPTYIWYLTDFANAAYGVFIFFIFVFKKNVWMQLKKRYYIWRGQPHLAHTLSSTQNTRTSNFSTADSVTVGADYKLNDLKNGRLEEKPLSIR